MNIGVKTTVAAVAKLDENLCVRMVRNCLGNPGFKDIVTNRCSNENIPENVQILTIFSNEKNVQKRTFK